jgi:hypothetical protein
MTSSRRPSNYVAKKVKSTLPAVLKPAALARVPIQDVLEGTVEPEPLNAAVPELLQEVQAYIAQHCTDIKGDPIADYHPIKGMAKMSVDPNVKDEVRLRAYSEVASYMFTRLRGIEIESHHEETVTFVVKKEFSFTGGDQGH